MKFIVDAQLPKSLSDFLIRKGFDSIHTLDLPAKNKTRDSQIAELAKGEERILISKDIDFLETFLIKSEPAKLILVKTGNIKNAALLKIFDENLDALLLMISRSNLVEISRSELAEYG